MQETLEFNDKKEFYLIRNNLYALAAFAPLDSRWKQLLEIDEFKNLPIVQSAFLRVLFAIVAFTIFPVICTLSLPTYLVDGQKLSGHNKTKIFLLNSLQQTTVPITQPAAPSKLVQPREGLDNFGNSCYINACIQAIVGFTPLYNLFFTSKAPSPLQESLLKLLRALKNSESGQSIVKPSLEHFYKELMKEETGWNFLDRQGICRMNDSTELLLFLTNLCEVSFTDISKISTTTTLLRDNEQKRVIEGDPEVFITIALDGTKESIEEYIHSKMRDSSFQASMTVCEIDSTTGEIVIDEKYLFLYFLNSKIYEGAFIKELNALPSYAFKEGSSLHKELLAVLKSDYATLQALYYSNPPVGYQVLINGKQDRTVISPDSTAIIVTIEKPSKTFVPDQTITIEGKTFKLEGVIRRPSGCHYTFFENTHPGQGVTYDDSRVTKDNNMSEARCLFYSKIEKPAEPL
jgi:hypothetical protein